MSWTRLVEKRKLEKQLFHGAYKPKREPNRKRIYKKDKISIEEAWLTYEEEKNKEKRDENNG